MLHLWFVGRSCYSKCFTTKEEKEQRTTHQVSNPSRFRTCIWCVCVCAWLCCNDSSMYVTAHTQTYLVKIRHTHSCMWDILLPGLLHPPTAVWLISWSNVGPCAFIFMHGSSLKAPHPPHPHPHKKISSPPAPSTPPFNYLTTGSQSYEMDAIIIISVNKVYLGTAALSTATRRHVLVAGGAVGPLHPNCFRQVKETGGRICSCALHVPGGRSAGFVSWGGRDTAVVVRVRSTLQKRYLKT